MSRTLELTAKVDRLRAFYRREGRAPGYNEMLGIFGYRSKNAVFGLLRKLQEAGYVVKRNRKIALTSRLTGGLRWLGAVKAGFPSPAEAALAETLTLDEFLIRKPDVTFMLTVSGDSMVEAGIHPGDWVLVERGATPRNRDIVVAQVEDAWTLNYFIKGADGVRLEPANRKHKPIVPSRGLVIGGVVRTVIRKYG
jgi:repressor LexA